MAQYEINKSPERKCSKKVFVNQAGYYGAAEKKAVTAVKCDSFTVVDKSGKVCFEGKARHFGYDSNSGDDVYILDFSGLTEDGRYNIVTDSGESSFGFVIGSKVYDSVFHDVMKAFYYLRCGCELKEQFAGKFTHDVCHNTMAQLWEDHGCELEVSGGWHDAGDYGRYVTAAACALAHLLYAYKLFPNAFDMTLNIPESGSGVPDILSECRYELEWLLKMQRDDGAVYHKLTTAQHAPFIMPEEDKAQLYVFAVSSMATADFAAICAAASGIYRKYDSSFADRLYSAAEKAYEWLDKNPDFVGFKNPEGNNTGGYGEWTDRDNRFWASAEMFAVSGSEKYHDDVKKAMSEDISFTSLGYSSIGGIGAMAYIFSGQENCDNDISEKLKKHFIDEAQRLAEAADNCGYGVAMSENDYCWGSTMNLMKQAMIFAVADTINGDNKYRKYAQAHLDSLLGVNALGYSYVSGTGEFCINYPHLRPAHADGIEECIPGMVSGGPNRWPCADDREVVMFAENTPPMKSFADDVRCYSLNEITIYWNSPAVFALAFIRKDFNNDE